MATNTCPTCKKKHQSATKCPYCGADVPAAAPEPEMRIIPDTKENRVISAKISTKEDTLDTITQTGPIIVVVIGILCCIAIIGIIPGLILIVLGCWWSTTKENEKAKLLNEIKELNAEMD